MTISFVVLKILKNAFKKCRRALKVPVHTSVSERRLGPNRINFRILPKFITPRITIKNIHSISSTGIDYISVGALTKNIEAIDFTMLINP